LGKHRSNPQYLKKKYKAKFLTSSIFKKKSTKIILKKNEKKKGKVGEKIKKKKR